MIIRIFKYPLEVTDTQKISIPAPATILSVAEQRNQIVLYALTSGEQKNMINYEIRIIGTGHPIEIDLKHYSFLGTVKLHNGDLMFHVFARPYPIPV